MVVLLVERYKMAPAFKKGKNLKDILVHRGLGPVNQRKPVRTQETIMRGTGRGVTNLTSNSTQQQELFT